MACVEEVVDGDRDAVIRWTKVRGKFASAAPVAVGCLLLLCGCPTYEDELTGRYQQVEIDEFDDEAIALDLFRFGGEVRAVLRYYDVGSAAARQEPFDPEHEMHCRWSRVAEFDDGEQRFTLEVPATSGWPDTEVEGRFDGEELLDLKVRTAGNPDEDREIRLQPGDDPPDSECRTIDDFLIHATFDDTGDNRLDPEVYEMRHPVYSMLWVGIERVGHTLVAINHPEPNVRLTDQGLFVDNGLIGSLSISVPPPVEQIRVESGDTRYALGHFTVIDDADGEGSFNWIVDEEPVVASALEEGRPDDVPDNADEDEINRWGKALLFVEGSLHQLDDSLPLVGIEEAEPNRHFYIVDIFAINEQIVSIRLPPAPEANRPVQRRVSVRVTDRYLDSDRVPVPRLFHN